MKTYPKIAQFREVDSLRERIGELGIQLPCDDQVLTAEAGSPLAQPWTMGDRRVGNRWTIHPMEGWDAQQDGSPSERTIRRWQNFGRSGAKLIWGGEAAAVREDGRANPNQTLAIAENQEGLAHLLKVLREAHLEQFDELEDLVVGLQLTHSGRFCRPSSKQLEPRIAYHHPLLDAKFGIAADDDTVVWTDGQLDRLIQDYRNAAIVAEQAGFDFVDIKACHGYLLHEFLSARSRPGCYGGDLDGRTRLLRRIIGQVQEACPDLMVGVRLSVFDTPPFVTSRSVGQPMDFQQLLPYEWGFGTSRENPLEMDLREPLELIGMLVEMGVAAINLSCGSPYYNPHLMRPASFPPSDGYFPPEDPLVGVARQVQATRLCKQAYPDCPMVGSGYSYMQDYLPQLAQAVVRLGWVDSVGLGRMVLSYPELPADSLGSGELRRKRICRTLSDCTTAPRNGLASGCYPLDPYYKQLPESEQLLAIKKSIS